MHFVLGFAVRRKKGMEDNRLTDEELLFKGMKFCNTHRSSFRGCSKCPLCNTVCISSEGNLIIGGADGNSINYVKFTEEFRKMIDIIMEDSLWNGNS